MFQPSILQALPKAICPEKQGKLFTQPKLSLWVTMLEQANCYSKFQVFGKTILSSQLLELPIWLNILRPETWNEFEEFSSWTTTAQKVLCNCCWLLRLTAKSVLCSSCALMMSWPRNRPTHSFCTTAPLKIPVQIFLYLYNFCSRTTIMCWITHFVSIQIVIFTVIPQSSWCSLCQKV